MVNDTLGQRHFRPDNDQLNALFLGCFRQPFDIIRADIQVTGNPSRTGITRGD